VGSSDEALLAGLGAGDREASAAFVRRFQRRAYGLARTIVRDSGTCGGSSGSSTGASPPENSSTGQTVAVANVDGVGKVLVDAQNMALYAADQEAGGKVVCTDGCTTIWQPLTVAGKPSSGAGLSGKLGTVKRPDGDRQVSFQGRLLYRFQEDPGPDMVTGNAVADSFDGKDFTWHVATPTGISSSSDNSTSSNGGYGY
jgi:predicted lipoprotein with Yx(FWY)xxD motif